MSLIDDLLSIQEIMNKYPRFYFSIRLKMDKLRLDLLGPRVSPISYRPYKSFKKRKTNPILELRRRRGIVNLGFREEISSRQLAQQYQSILSAIGESRSKFAEILQELKQLKEEAK